MDFLNTTAAAAMLGVAPATLVQWRHLGRGPDFHKVGRLVRYKRADLDAFLNRSRHWGQIHDPR